MNKQPQSLTYSMMQEAIDSGHTHFRQSIFINREIVVLNGSPEIFARLMLRDTPFRIHDIRMGIALQGELHGVVNLREHHILPGDIVYIGPGSVVQPVSVSPDFRLMGIALLTDFPMPFSSTQIPTAFNGQVRNFHFATDKQTQRTTESLFQAMWQLVQMPDYSSEAISNMAAVLMHHYSQLYQKNERLHIGKSNEQEILNRFLQLVNDHSSKHHQIDYYADRMCLTSRYLGTLVRQASGITAKEWIDRSLITTAKMMLRLSNRQTTEIAEELGFANPSFFCKYFKRLTGLTPRAYKYFNK